jgi:hypothetical protein
MRKAVYKPIEEGSVKVEFQSLIGLILIYTSKNTSLTDKGKKVVEYLKKIDEVMEE